MFSFNGLIKCHICNRSGFILLMQIYILAKSGFAWWLLIDFILNTLRSMINYFEHEPSEPTAAKPMIFHIPIEPICAK